MKKFYSLLAVVLLSVGAYAQEKPFVDRVINGNCEGPETTCFWVHEYRDGERFEGEAVIIEDPTDPTNHVAISRAVDPDDAASQDDWDTQFFVYVQEKINVGDEYRLTMRIRADKAANSQTQAHNTPGDYNYWSMCGDIPFTEEWQTVEKTGVIGQQQVYGSDDPETSEREMHTIAFNLYVLKEANTYYFDDIKLEIKEAEPPKPFEEWFDMVKNGDLATDDVSSFTGRDGYSGAYNESGSWESVDTPARIVEIDGVRAMNVTSIAEMPLREDGTAADLTDWQTQFFVTIPHVLKLNQQFRFKMEYKADQEATVQTQIHYEPGNYLYYQMLGDINFTPEWQTFEVEGTINSNQSGGYTIAFNCNVLKDVNNYYFRNIVFEVNEADVLDSERTLGSEDIVLPVPAPDAEPAVATIDMTPAVEALGWDFEELVSGEHMRVMGAEGFVKEKISPVFTGATINEKGEYDPEGFIILEIDPESKDNQALFNISNFGTEALADGQTINSKLAFMSKGGWYYIYNVAFVNQTGFEGIDEVNANANVSNKVYDLTGREVKNPTKGIYIINGKKYIQK